ncbi:MAG: hypothetical protein ACTHMS_13260 [Jatrophihabitans sp.]|uniref:hypothetical protein n=1 Tax=Jatrophihabitans sp. TaxID=1932789 RepID=UPI003F7CFA96
MPRYRFLGEVEHFLLGLSHGVNATIERDRDPDREPDGSTVVARPGDVITTTEPYESPLLEVVDDAAKPASKAAAKKAPAKAAAKPAPPAQPTPPVTDPVTPDATTTPAEGQE